MFHTPSLLTDDVTRAIAQDLDARFVDPVTSLRGRHDKYYCTTIWVLSSMDEEMKRKNFEIRKRMQLCGNHSSVWPLFELKRRERNDLKKLFCFRLTFFYRWQFWSLLLSLLFSLSPIQLLVDNFRVVSALSSVFAWDWSISVGTVGDWNIFIETTAKTTIRVWNRLSHEIPSKFILMVDSSDDDAALTNNFFCITFLCSLLSSSAFHLPRVVVGQSQENHNNSSVISQSSSNIAETSSQQVTQSRIINQTLQSINNNNNNNSTIAKSKIHLNVDQQISDNTTSNAYKEDDSLLNEPNNNTNNNSKSLNSSSSTRPCYRYHPVSRRGTEFISQQVPGFRSFGGNNKYITQKNKYWTLTNRLIGDAFNENSFEIILGINRRRKEVNPRANDVHPVEQRLVVVNSSHRSSNNIQAVNKHHQTRVE